MQCLTNYQQYFEVNLEADRKPAKCSQHRSDMLKHHALDNLQPPDILLGQALLPCLFLF